jgi:hypothetical protein
MDTRRSVSAYAVPVSDGQISYCMRDNANRRHYRAAAEALAQADPDWLERIITRWVPSEEWPNALERRPDAM